MNPEEFDKRLSNCFKDEFLPPDDKLWQNINTRLDHGSKKPFWYWLIPVVIVFVAIGAWLLGGNGLTDNNNIAQNNKSTTGVSSDNNVDKTSNATITTEVREENSASETENNNEATTNDTPKLPVTAVSENTSTTSNNTRSNNNNSSKPQQRATQPERPKYTRPTAIPIAVATSTTNTNPTIDFDNDKVIPLKYRRIQSLNNFIYFFNTDSFVTFSNPVKKVVKSKPSSPYTNNPVDFDKKWWWNFGMGPQIAYNEISVSNELKDFVHYELWNNKSKLTNNGSGFQSHLYLGYRFGKHFSFESGLQYSLRTEPIKLNVTSYDNAARGNDNRILGYVPIKLMVIAINPNTGQRDTTFYDGVSNFSLAHTNKYHIFTVPLRFNTEWKLTPNTRFIGGIGAGLSVISSKKSTHLDIVEGNAITEKKLRSFSGSLNAHLGFYTNFNDIGEIGIYSGFQMYAAPWQINNKQYAIKMSDMQFGISFRRPLNWGK